MSGSKVNNFSIGDSNIQSVMLTLDKAYKGLHQVSLTNYNNTSASQIAAGSVVENNGALYQFTSNESITGSPSNGTVYIRLVPSGDTITAEYTNTAPTWSDSKQGWYGTGGDANKRYLEFVLYKESTGYILKDSLTVGNGQNLNINLHYKASGLQVVSGGGVNVAFPNKIYNIHADDSYNPSTGVFTAPYTGMYGVSHLIGSYSTTITGKFLSIGGDNLSHCFNIPISDHFIATGFVFFVKKGEMIRCVSNLVSSDYTIPNGAFVKIKSLS